jgi:ABC-type antimicrobial peptide transport system permease subunit
MDDKEVTYGRMVLEGGSVFFTYLRRELLNRRRQTIVVALGLAIGIALVSTVSAISSGVKDSQAQVLDSLYGIGTDITITQRAAPGDGPPRFDVGSGDGQQSDGVRTISRTRLRTERGASTFDDATVLKITSTKGVAAVATALKLTNTTFEGELPTFMQRRQGNGGDAAVVPDGNSRQPQPGGFAQSNPEAAVTTTTLELPTGGADGKGGSAFSITEFSVLGITADRVEVGPMASVALTGGRLLTSADVGKNNAVLDSTYATTEALKLDGSITIAGEKFTVVGLVGPSAGAAETASNVYIPIDVARTLASVESGVTNIYVKAKSGDSVSMASTALATLLPDATISTSADLAKTVSGSLSTASDLLSSFGKWLSFIVIIVAFALAMLFTISGVTRRTREFGTLKALGWKSNKIVRQVMAESAVQGIIGGVIGAGLAFGAVQIVNAIAPTLQAATGGQGFGGGRFGGGNGPGGNGFGGNGPGGGINPFGGRVPGQSTFDVVLHAAITPSILGLAIGLAVAGGLLAGAAGGMRAARLRPAESLRSVA